MKIDGIRSWVNKNGCTQFEVISIYDSPKVSGIWALSGRWFGSEPPVLDMPVRYIQGKFGFLALPEAL